MLMPQLLSLKVVNAPVPGSLPVNSARCLRKRPEGVCNVVVNESHVDSGMRVLKLLGWPKRGVSSESWCQSAQESSECGSVAAGLAGRDVLLPKLEEDVMEPSVMKQIS